MAIKHRLLNYSGEHFSLLCVSLPHPPSSWSSAITFSPAPSSTKAFIFSSPSTVTSIISLGFSSDHHRLPCYSWTTISNDTISASASAFHLSDSAIHGPHRSSSASLAPWQPSVPLTWSDSILFSLLCQHSLSPAPFGLTECHQCQPSCEHL